MFEYDTAGVLSERSEYSEFLACCGAAEAHHVEGKATGWLCLDYGTVVIHLLERKQRDYYQLERLWGDGEKQDITSLLEAE